VDKLPLDSLLSIKRAGMVLVNSHCRLAVGIDNQSGDIGPFAGSPIRADGGIIRTAEREFREESLGVFGKIPHHVVAKGLAVYNEEELIIFCPLDFNERDAMTKFNKKVKADSEMKQLFFCDPGELVELLCSKTGKTPIYERVRRLLIDTIHNEGNFLA